MHWRDLDVWKKAHALVLEMYKITAEYPKNEAYSLVDQLRRSAYSIPANIVEGQSRNTTKEYLSFLGSLSLLYSSQQEFPYRPAMFRRVIQQFSMDALLSR